jgi:DNA-binding MarR family transcriptional regulator
MQTIFDSYGFLFGKVLETMVNTFEDKIREHTITAKHYGVMLVIHSNPNISQKEIGEIQRIDRTTMVALIDYLENIGFVKRIKNPSDRRAYYLSLTDKGIHVLDECRDILEKCELAALKPLSEEERAKLKEWLLKIYQQP